MVHRALCRGLTTLALTVVRRFTGRTESAQNLPHLRWQRVDVPAQQRRVAANDRSDAQFPGEHGMSRGQPTLQLSQDDKVRE